MNSLFGTQAKVESELLVKKLNEIQGNTDPRALKEEHRTEKGIYPTTIPVPFKQTDEKG